jgi:hypothetical protein
LTCTLPAAFWFCSSFGENVIYPWFFLSKFFVPERNRIMQLVQLN